MGTETATITSLARTVTSDRTGLLGAAAANIAGFPPSVIACYMIVRLAIPVFLVVLACRGATAKQRIDLVRHYLGAHHRRAARRRA